MSPDVSIPKRALFKPSEVCSIAAVKPYILRSWEAEFPTLGRGKKKDGARVYRRADVEMVLKIKGLVFGEGLTLGAARRKIEAEAPPEPAGTEQEVLGDLLDADARERLAEVKKGLRSILKILSASGDASSSQSESAGGQVEVAPVLAAEVTKTAGGPPASAKRSRRRPKKKSA